jgi:predicted nuclease of predicted toxin-antitoxin system
MRFKVDENLPQEVAEQLRKVGYDAATVLQQGIGGTRDATLWAICQEEGRVLMTLDLDFADIRVYPPEEASGIIVLRLRQQDKPSVVAVLKRLIPFLDQEPLDRHLWIVDEQHVRIR